MTIGFHKCGSSDLGKWFKIDTWERKYSSYTVPYFMTLGKVLVLCKEKVFLKANVSTQACFGETTGIFISNVKASNDILVTPHSHLPYSRP